jgi:hypothetical protein
VREVVIGVAHIKFHYKEISIAICNAMLCTDMESHAKQLNVKVNVKPSSLRLLSLSLFPPMPTMPMPADRFSRRRRTRSLRLHGDSVP